MEPIALSSLCFGTQKEAWDWAAQFVVFGYTKRTMSYTPSPTSPPKLPSADNHTEPYCDYRCTLLEQFYGFITR